MKLPTLLKPKLPRLPNIPGLKLKKTTIFIVLCLWIMALIWLWTFGPEFEFSNMKPFAALARRWLITLVSVVLIMAWIVALLIKRLQRLTSLQKQVKEEVKDPVQIEVNQQQRYLSRWLLRLQKQLMSKNFRYQLPWYLAIGSQNSGKTTFLKEGCKLNELYSPEHGQAVHCWLNDQAVIIEADGVLFDQPTNSPLPSLYERLWKNTLEWLVAERTRQPLNGIILTVDIYQFSTFTKHEKDAYISNVKNRLNDIVKTLNTKLPVYIVLTKLDLLYGFEAMYQTLDKNQREEIVGITFSTSDNDWHNALEAFWVQWIKQLNSALPGMMLNNVDVGQRSQLFTFVRQVHGIKDYVYQLIDNCFYSLKKQPLMLRGVYLTSSLQKGQMEDLFVKSAASQYNLPEQIYPSWQTPLSHTYFTHNLLESVLFKEPHLAGENTLEKTRHNHQLYRLGASSAAAVIAVLIGWQYYYSHNYTSGEEVLLKAQEYMNIHISDQKDFFGNLQLPLLNPIGEATLAYGDYHNRSKIFSDMGLYQGYKIGPYVESTYLKLLQQRFLPAVMNGLQIELDRAEDGSEQKLRILRIMRMIEDESGRDKNMVIQHMLSRWSDEFKGQSDIQTQLHKHLAYALDHIKWKTSRAENNRLAIESYLPYQQSIKDAQVDLRRLAIYQRVYQNVHSQSRAALPIDLNIRNQIGAGFDTVFQAENENLLRIPQLLTRAGLVGYFILQDDKLIQLTSLDSWVLELTANVHYSEADRKEIERQITALYLNDYVSTWHSAYNNIHIKQFADIPEAIKALEQITSGEQIFRRAIVLLKENSSPKDSAISDDTKLISTGNLFNQRDYHLLNYLSHEFKNETSVIIENNDQLSALQNANTKLTELHRYLLAIQNSPSPGKAALQAVQIRINNNGSDPIFEAQQLAKTLPEPLGRWVGELANETWNVIMIEAIKSLEVEWNEKVVSQYKLYFADRYPFNPAAKLDVPLSEFERFFGYGGTLDSFYQQNLKAFIENNLGADKAGAPLIRQDVLRQLEQAEKIRRTYFTKQGLGIQFSLQPIEMSGNRRRGILNLDGQLVEYKHASNNAVRLIWPNSMRDNIESRLNLIGSAERSKTVLYTGPWGLIRLINSGKLTNVKHDTFDIRYDIDNGYIIYRVYIDESDNPFAGGLFSKFTLPSTLY